MPSDYSSEHSRDDAAELARRIGAGLPRAADRADGRRLPRRARRSPGVAEENLQARVRGDDAHGPVQRSEGHLVLATGNKSELAVGYSTLYGDSVGGFAPLKDVPKTLVWQLARWRNAEAARRGETPPIPESSISKPPSAELRPGQLDKDSLPAYDVLDAVLERLRRAATRAARELLAAGFDPALVDQVVRLVDRAECKRRQFAARPQDLGQGVRPRPPAADHQPLARARARGGPATRHPTVSPRGRRSSCERSHRRRDRPAASSPRRTAVDPAAPSGAPVRAGARAPPARR